MTRTDTLAELACVIQRQNPDYMPLACVRLAARLLRLAATVQRYAVLACNRELTEREDRLRRNAIDRVQAFGASSLAWTIECDGDPRGFVVRAVKVPHPSGHGYLSNGWDHDSFGIG